MSTINVTINDHTAEFTNMPIISSGSVNVDKIQFTFDSTWDGYSKVAIFFNNPETVYRMPLSSNGSCHVPWEVIQDEGHICVSVYGVKDDIIKTSIVLRYRIEQGAITSNTEESEELTPELIDQIIDAVGGKADINSPIFTGVPKAPTPSSGDNSTKIATTEFVQNAMNSSFSGKAGASYIIDNSQWNIVVDDVNKATSNAENIQNAINHAYSNGCTDVYLSSGTYWVDTQKLNVYHGTNSATSSTVLRNREGVANDLTYPGAIALPTGITFHNSPDTILKAKPVNASTMSTSEFDIYTNRGYCIFVIFNAKNAGVIGGTLIGERNGHVYKANPPYSEGENTSCISIKHPCKYINIQNVYMKESVGDSAQIRDGYSAYPAEHITFTNCTFDSSRRSGLAISGEHINFIDCKIINIGNTLYGVPGTTVSDGIRIEPISPQMCRYVKIDGCYFDNIVNNGVQQHSNMVRYFCITNSTFTSSVSCACFLRWGVRNIVTNNHIESPKCLEIYSYQSGTDEAPYASELQRCIFANNYCIGSSLNVMGTNVVVTGNMFENPGSISFDASSTGAQARQNGYRYGPQPANTIFSNNIVFCDDFSKNAAGNIITGMYLTGPNLVCESNFLTKVIIQARVVGPSTSAKDVINGVIFKNNTINGGSITSSGDADISNNTFQACKGELINSDLANINTAIRANSTDGWCTISGNTIINYKSGIYASSGIKYGVISNNNVKNESPTMETSFGIIAKVFGTLEVLNNTVSNYSLLYSMICGGTSGVVLSFTNNVGITYANATTPSDKYPVLFQLMADTYNNNSDVSINIFNNMFNIKNPTNSIPFMRFYLVKNAKIIGNIVDTGKGQVAISFNNVHDMVVMNNTTSATVANNLPTSDSTNGIIVKDNYSIYS